MATGPQPPGHHQRWLDSVRPRLDALDLRPITLLQPRRGFTPDFFSPPPAGPAARFDDELDRIAATPPDRVRAEIAASLAETPGAARTAVGRRLLGPPEEALALLVELIRAAWQALVEPVWPRVRALLDAEVAHRSRLMAEGGLDAVLDGLHPSLEWRDGVLTRTHGLDDHRDLGGAGLVLLPSAFKWDEVVAITDPAWQPTLVYPARGLGNLWRQTEARGGAALARLVGRTRAVLLLGLTVPATTTSLAHRHALAASTVSEHLAVLRGAGLVTGERYRHEIRYRWTELGASLCRGGAGGVSASGVSASRPG